MLSTLHVSYSLLLNIDMIIPILQMSKLKLIEDG